MSDTHAPDRTEKADEITIAGVERMAQPEIDSALASMPAANSRSPFYALTFRNFRLFFIGQLISVAGTWMQQVAQNWVVWDLTRDPRWLGFVNAANAIPYVMFSIWGGHLADRHSKRTILIINQTAQMLLAFALAVLATNHFIKMQAWHIVLLSGLLGLSSAFNMPAQQAFVAELVERRDALSNAIALSSLRFNLARVVGPMLAGIALQKFGPATCFGVNGLSFIAVIICLAMMRVAPVEQIDHEMHVLEGFRYIYRTQRVLRIILLIGTGSLFTWSVSTLFPMLASVFHRGTGGFTVIMIFNGIGAALGAGLLAALVSSTNRRLQVYGGASLFCVALLAMSFAVYFWQVLVLLTVGGFAMIVFGMASQTLVQEEVPDELRGRVMAVYSLVFQGLFPIGGLEVGFLANRFGALHAIRINAILCLAMTLVIYAWSVSSRRKAGALSANELTAAGN